MLALSRKKNESIIIDNNIEVTVLDIKGDQIKLGIIAPKSVPVYRKEVYVQIKDANKEASSSDGAEILKDFLG
jgi:carbon storage regulator